MPPARSGVADHAHHLLRVLREGGSVELAPARATVNLYHLGNNELHAEIYRRALREPGVIVLHDAVLHHFLLGILTHDEYIEEFVFNYGGWASGMAEQLWRNRASSAADNSYFEYPMLRRIAEASRAVIVHNPQAERTVRAHAPNARIVQIPLLPNPYPHPSACEVSDLREQLELGPSDIVCGVFGHLRESKRLRNVIEACESRGLKLLIAGDCPSDLSRSLERWFAKPFVRRVGHSSSRTFPALLSAADVCINLRYPSAGETSAIAIGAMSLRRPVIVSESYENSLYPGDAVVRVAHGVAEGAHLSFVLEWLKHCPSDRQEIGRRASDYVEKAHGAPRIAQLYWDVLEALKLRLMRFPLALILVAGFAVAAERQMTARISMRDHVQLSANVFLPQAPGRFPTLLIRTPYGKGSSLITNYRAFVERGYAIVVQDVRGKYDSEGDFRPLTQELPDGDDTITWIARQAWSDGKVGMLGGSYLGIAQWRAALSRNPHLMAIFPVVAGGDEFRDRFYSRGGAMKLGHRLHWISQNLKLPWPFRAEFADYVRHLPLRTADRAATGRKIDFWQQAMSHPTYDEFWRARSTYEHLDLIQTPRIVGGWYDNFVEGDLDAYAWLSRRSAAHRIVIGPWPHSMTAPYPSGVSFGPDAFAPLRRMQLEWFDHWLRGTYPTPDFPHARVRIFVMGADRWRDEDEWPLSRARLLPWYLSSDRGANTLKGDGKLLEKPGRDDVDNFLYDPLTPVPTAGGSVCCDPKVIPWGPTDQRPVEAREDVLVYTSAPLKSDLEVTGTIRVVLEVASSAPDTDFTAKISDVYPDGYARNLCDGILRLRYRDRLDKIRLANPGEIYKITVDAGVTSNLFKAGHRIRLDISSSNFPRFDRNPNTGRSTADEQDVRTARQTVFHGKLHRHT